MVVVTSWGVGGRGGQGVLVAHSREEEQSVGAKDVDTVLSHTLRGKGDSGKSL